MTPETARIWNRSFAWALVMTCGIALVCVGVNECTMQERSGQRQEQNINTLQYPEHPMQAALREFYQQEQENLENVQHMLRSRNQSEKSGRHDDS